MVYQFGSNSNTLKRSMMDDKYTTSDKVVAHDFMGSSKQKLAVKENRYSARIDGNSRRKFKHA
ncbi:MAG: hypothetical protein RL240_1778 [Planctomycetota bacterium]